MSSKKLQFKQTATDLTNKWLNEVDKMSDVSFNTIVNASETYVDIQMMSPEDSIIQSLKNLMTLPVGGNVLFPNRGERVGNMLFAPGLSQREAETFLMSYLQQGEPRIRIHSVSGTKKVDEFNEQIVTLNVSYSFKNKSEIENVILDLKSSDLYFD